jgi:tetratricopeptide (TPR) repeat protein
VDPGHEDGLAVLAALARLEQDEPSYERWKRSALARSPTNARFFAELADILGFLHLYPEIDEVLTEAAGLAPEDPYVQSALGLNLLRLGRETRGREALERAWKRDRFNRRTYNVLELYEKRIDRSYSTREDGNLWLRLPTKDDEIIGPGLVAATVRARTALDRRYGQKAGPLRLEFFATPEEFSVRTTGVTNFGATAVCFGRLITFVGPYHGTHNIDQVIWHELAHVYAVTRSRGRVPRWFTEGLSEWETELAEPAWARESAELLTSARRQGKLRRLGELELAFIRAESPKMMEVAYSTAAYAIRYLGETYGLPKLIAMLDGYGRGLTTEALVRDHLGKELATLEREFDTWLAARLDERVRGWEPTAVPEGAKTDERDQLFARAKTQIERRRLVEAKGTLERLIASGGDGYGPRLLLARVLLASKSPENARPHLEQAQAFHKEAVEPPALLAELAARQGLVDDEKLHLAHALGIDAHAFAPAARLLMLSIVTDDAAARTRALGRARAIAPLHPIVLSARALVMAQDGKPTAASPLVERALRGLERGSDATDTLVVAALAAHATGDASNAEILAARARRDDALPAAARKALDAFGGNR